jgi:hypothetical protein
LFLDVFLKVEDKGREYLGKEQKVILF